jgi:hypothetical protein
LKKKTFSLFAINKMNKPDLLGCVCLYDDECTRNCRIEGEEFNVPPNIKPILTYYFSSTNKLTTDLLRFLCPKTKFKSISYSRCNSFRACFDTQDTWCDFVLTVLEKLFFFFLAMCTWNLLFFNLFCDTGACCRLVVLNIEFSMMVSRQEFFLFFNTNCSATFNQATNGCKPNKRPWLRRCMYIKAKPCSLWSL